jgi:oxaloacetate decarboxylase alpha subunit
MNEINFIDTTLRDAHQSLWGVKMSTAMAYQIASTIDRAGYKAIDITAPAHFVFLIRHFRENPWERLKLLSEKITNTPLSIMMLASSFVTFNPMKGPIIDLMMKRCFANGLRRIQPMDASNNMSDIDECVQFAKNAGLEVVVPLIFSETPVHTDEYFAQKARDALEMGVDAIYLKDPGGLLTPDRIRTLVPIIQENIDGLPLELHSHCTTGLAPLCYLEAVKIGVKTVHTASLPLANGSSQPSTENILQNVRQLGFSDNLDDGALKVIAAYFTSVAKSERLPMGAPLQYDLGQYEHQIPGGVISNLRRQLSDMGQEQRSDEVIEESIRVRKDLGYPIMVTPFSQYVVTQATLNILLGGRYKEVIDEVIKLAMGYYGRQAGNVDQNLLDRVESLPKAKEYANWEVPRPTIKELRKVYGLDVSDDELLLRILCQGENDIKALHAAGPIKTYYPYAQKPLMGLIKDLVTRTKPTHVYIRKGDFSLKLSKSTK